MHYSLGVTAIVKNKMIVNNVLLLKTEGWITTIDMIEDETVGRVVKINKQAVSTQDNFICW